MPGREERLPRAAPPAGSGPGPRTSPSSAPPARKYCASSRPIPCRPSTASIQPTVSAISARANSPSIRRRRRRLAGSTAHDPRASAAKPKCARCGLAEVISKRTVAELPGAGRGGEARPPASRCGCRSRSGRSRGRRPARAARRCRRRPCGATRCAGPRPPPAPCPAARPRTRWPWWRRATGEREQGPAQRAADLQHPRLTKLNPSPGTLVLARLAVQGMARPPALDPRHPGRRPAVDEVVGAGPAPAAGSGAPRSCPNALRVLARSRAPSPLSGARPPAATAPRRAAIDQVVQPGGLLGRDQVPQVQAQHLVGPGRARPR